MSRLLKKLIASFLISILLTLNAVPTAKAQTPGPTPGPWYNQNFTQWSSKVFDDKNPSDIFGERYTYAQVNWIINSLIAVVTGPAVSNCASLANTGDLAKVAECMKGFPLAQSSGAIGGLAYLTGSLLSIRPASGIEYVKERAARLQIIPQAYAQSGGGFRTLNPIQTLWGAVRNISYALIILVFVVMAFMIMFRVKISPQAAITVQSALPRIVTALILITFSYAIAGFLLDLMYVVVGAFAAMINMGGNTISNSNVIDLFNQLTSVNGLVSISVGLLLFTIILAVFGFALTGLGIVGTVTIPVIGSVGILGGIILLIGAIFILWILVRLLWLMIKTACITVLLIVVSPLMILMGSFSGTIGFGTWFRLVASNLAVYPTVIAMVFLSHYFFWGWFLGSAAGVFGDCGRGGFNTFCINTGSTRFDTINLPGMPIGTPILGFFAAFIILFLIPKASEVIQGIISGKGVNLQGAVGQALAPIGAIAGGGIGYESGRQQQRYTEAQRYVLEEAAKGRTASIPGTIEREKDFWNFIRGISGGKIK